MKNQKEILTKLGIKELNPMQLEARAVIHSKSEILLLSPTGTGKTLAFMLPILSELDAELHEVQALIIVPSRELAIQIEQVIRNAGTGFKTNAAYGGQSFNQDTINIKHRPAILIGTPGRIADHLRRNSFSTEFIQTLVLDEFDKSLEIGFEKEMKLILRTLMNVKKKILTSATLGVSIPEFVEIENPVFINYLDDGKINLKIKKVESPTKDKLECLFDLVCHLGNKPGIIFLNFKESIARVSDFLTVKGIEHGCFHGGMEQNDREQALIKFRNGTNQLILATDLAARGLDIPEISFIIHYHLPNRPEEFTHRNGRTARMSREGTAYVLSYSQEKLPDFIGDIETEKLDIKAIPFNSVWSTLFLSGGRRDKISKGDILGFLIKEGEVDKASIGQIELKQDCAFVAVHKSDVKKLIEKLNNTKLKKRKLRIYVL